MSDDYILYDLPTKGRCACFSGNAWKVRLVLNYKNLPYKTEWLEYPELGPVLKSHGVPPNPEGSFAAYSVPTIRLPDGSFIMDSLAIAEKLEALHPNPSLHLDTGVHKQVIPVFMGAFWPLTPELLAKVHRNLLRDASRSWYYEDRLKRFGKSVDELEREKGGDQMWEAAKPGVEKLAAELKGNRKDEGPFVLGSQVSYGDFVIAGLLQLLKRVDQSMFDRFIAHDEAFVKLYEACRPWLARDDH